VHNFKAFCVLVTQLYRAEIILQQGGNRASYVALGERYENFFHVLSMRSAGENLVNESKTHLSHGASLWGDCS
jgi:hypothetical protein